MQLAVLCDCVFPLARAVIQLAPDCLHQTANLRHLELDSVVSLCVAQAVHDGAALLEFRQLLQGRVADLHSSV